jgi:DNA-binding transcriptional LysR family regulator
MNEFEAMKNFVRVVEAGSISKAAEQLDMAKSGVSRRLADLEDRLGVRLMNRSTRRSSLTEAGQAYYQGAVKLLADVAELNAAAAGSRASLSGALRLSVPLSFGLRHLSPAIDEFMQANPDLFIKIDFSDRQADLVGEGIDLAIRIADLGDSVLQARRICPIRLLLCASPAYLAEHGTPRTPDQLKSHRLLQYEIGTTAPLRETWLGFCRIFVPVNSARTRSTHPPVTCLAGPGYSSISWWNDSEKILIGTSFPEAAYNVWEQAIRNRFT